MEATLLLRYNGPESSYYGGSGAFGARFFIGKVSDGPLYQAPAAVGRSNSLALNKPDRIRLDFNGSHLTLFENDVQQLVLVDETYQIGPCGLGTFQTRARFANIVIKRAVPQAFVIMPFTSELDFVHLVLRRTIESYNIKYVRADEIAVSRPIMEDVKQQIAGADLVIVDFTGINPNVYYEAGLADAWKKIGPCSPSRQAI
jgi:hypothetical protein